jgi:hypothetical protein
MTRLEFMFPQIATGDLDVPIVRQLPAENLPFGDEFEPGPVEVIGFEAAFRRDGLCKQDLEYAPRNTHDASYSPTPTPTPTPMPNSTTERSGFHRVSGGKRKNMNLQKCSAKVLMNMPRTDHSVEPDFLPLRPSRAIQSKLI